MTVERRTFLRLSGAAGIGVIAGCSGESQSETPDENTTTTDQSAPTADETTAGDVFAQQAKLTATDGDSRDFFGSVVALAADGTTALIGAPEDEDPNGSLGGAAYVFGASGGSWEQQAKLAAADGDENDKFASSVALSADGTTAVVGTPNDDETTGSAYVFVSTDGWSQRAKLTADDGNSDDFFGSSVALSADGTTALIGASEDEDPNGLLGGSAYVFGASSGSWEQRTKLAATDGDENDNFGSSVALSADGTTAVIGAASDDDPNGGEQRYGGAGSAYVFTAEGGWSQQAKLAADDGNSGDAFGWSVALASGGTTAIVGAPDDESGSAYVFTAVSGWSQQAKLTADDGDSGDAFGRAVALADGATALVGARLDGQPNDNAGGSAYVFAGSDGWSQQAKLAANDGDSGDAFGDAVTVSDGGETALIGAIGDEDPNGDRAGSAYVFGA